MGGSRPSVFQGKGPFRPLLLLATFWFHRHVAFRPLVAPEGASLRAFSPLDEESNVSPFLSPEQPRPPDYSDERTAHEWARLSLFDKISKWGEHCGIDVHANPAPTIPPRPPGLLAPLEAKSVPLPPWIGAPGAFSVGVSSPGASSPGHQHKKRVLVLQKGFGLGQLALPDWTRVVGRARGLAIDDDSKTAVEISIDHRKKTIGKTWKEESASSDDAGYLISSLLARTEEAVKGLEGERENARNSQLRVLERNRNYFEKRLKFVENQDIVPELSRFIKDVKQGGRGGRCVVSRGRRGEEWGRGEGGGERLCGGEGRWGVGRGSGGERRERT